MTKQWYEKKKTNKKKTNKQANNSKQKIFVLYFLCINRHLQCIVLLLFVSIGLFHSHHNTKQNSHIEWLFFLSLRPASCVWWSPSHIALCFMFCFSCVLFLVYPRLSVSQYCPFVIFPLVSLTFIQYEIVPKRMNNELTLFCWWTTYSWLDKERKT